MLEIILISLAVLGGIATIYGNCRIIRDVGSEKPIRRFITLCVAPMFILTTLIRHYRRGRTGGFIAIAGMWLMVPYFGNRLWEQQNSMKGSVNEHRQASEEQPADMEDDEEDAGPVRGSQPPQNQKLAEKEKLVSQLNARLAWWHEQLQQRRASLAASDPVAVTDFNAEAAAYAGLNAIAKEKNAELMTLRSVAKR